MKKLLLMLIISICGIAWRSEDILKAIDSMKATSAPQSISVQSLTVKPDQKTPKGMSLSEFSELAKTDPEAYNKFIQGNQPKQERTDLDKLANFFSHLKYE